MKDLIFNQLTVLILFIGALYLGYRAFFTMDTTTAFWTLGFTMCGVLGREVQSRIKK